MRYGLAGAVAVALMVSASPIMSQVETTVTGTPASRETIQRLFAVTRMEAFQAQILRGAIENYAQIPAMAQFADVARTFLEKHASFAAMEEELIAAHREFYSEEDLVELIRFYQSPLGQRVVAVTPLLTARVGQVTSDRINALLPQLMAEILKRGGGG